MLTEEQKEDTTQPTDNENVSGPKDTVESTGNKAIDNEEKPDADDAYRIDDEEETDFSQLTKEQLVELAEKVSKEDDLKEATRIIKEIRPVLEGIFADEAQQALDRFLEDGNDKEDFEFKADEYKTRFHEAGRHLQQRKSDQHERIEQEKQKNLEAKRKILEQLKELTETEETTESLSKVKELQNEWKKIRAVPIEFVQELWDNYRFHLDKFYDNLSINFELKELDRKKNLETKIELCMKVDQLSQEPSVKKAMNLLNKYHDEWKHTGPVPKEYSEEIWTRFKAASDKVFEEKKAELDRLKEKRVKNLELKTAICEKLELLASGTYSKPKEWIETTKKISDVFDEWKSVGPVPKENNEEIWNRFKELRNNFYRAKNQFFKELNKDKAENLKAKLALCEKAEEIKDSEDWNKTTNELIRLQAEWKKTGPAPDKQSEEVWKRFRAACDSFFDRKEEHFKGQKTEQAENLKVKQELIEKLKGLQEKEDVEEVFNELREIQKTWNKTGFVPLKFKNDLQNSFTELADKLYKKFRRNKEEMSEVRLKDHYKELAELPDGDRRMQGEERKIKEKIRFLKNDVVTLENNIGFFSNSKTAGPLIKGIKDKIDKANAQLERLEKELKMIKSVH